MLSTNSDDRVQAVVTSESFARWYSVDDQDDWDEEFTGGRFVTEDEIMSWTPRNTNAEPSIPPTEDDVKNRQHHYLKYLRERRHARMANRKSTTCAAPAAIAV